MSEWTDALRNTAVDWRRTTHDRYVFEAVVEGRRWLLRLNDFPDEPICTVIFDGEELDLETFPASWTLPAHRGEE